MPAVSPGGPTRGTRTVSTTLHRAPRLEPPEPPEGELALQPPPEIEPSEGSSAVLMNALPMLGSLGSIVFIASTGGTRGFLAGGMFLAATLGFVGVSVWRQRSQRSTKTVSARREYLRYLAQVRGTVREAARRQREAALWDHPDPAHLPALVAEQTRVWERGGDDPDLLQVRYGVSPQPLALRLTAPETAPIDQLDPVAASALHRLLVTHRVQPDLPAALDLRAFWRVEVVGEADAARALARALVCSAAAFHSPDQLRVAVLADEDSLAGWDWLKWLPHAGSPHERDGAGPARMVSSSFDDLAPLLPADLADRARFSARAGGAPALPHLLVVVDGGRVPPGNHVITADGVQGVTVVDLPSTWGELEDDDVLRLHLDAGCRGDGRVPVRAVRVRSEPVPAFADQLDRAGAEALARRLAPLHVGGGPVRKDASGEDADLLDLLGLGDVRDLDVGRAWRPRPPRDRLRVPVGLAADGSPVQVDIKESAQQGMGPHGLVVGATGSGKSEFLRTLVLGMALTHSPEVLNLVLVDFKGGATFAGMADLPHVSAVITNLAEELTLVDRMQDALTGEMVRRQELLREAGNFASIKDYDRARTAGEPLEPLPSLFVVVDEFSELLSAKPEFIDLFVAIGRLGRSLGLHLLLASQRLEEGRLRGLDSHLSYRVGLRTFSAAESRTVLGVPDAYELPPVPGLGYLKPDQSTLLRFKSSYVSGPPPSRGTASRARGSGRGEVLPFTLAPVLRTQDLLPTQAAEEPTASVHAPADQRSVLDLAVEAMAAAPWQGRRAHQVWLPPLDAPATLDQLMPDLAVDAQLGLVSRGWRERGQLVVPIGVVDRPLDQRRETLVADLGGAAGHVTVVGGPRSGKSTLARTVVASLALTRTPAEVQFYVLDFGGGAFAALQDLPHVAGVATRAEPDVVRRVVAELEGITQAREAYFRRHGIDSVETYRSRRAAGLADDGYGDVFLVVDGWSTLRSEFDTLELRLQDLAQRGLTFGVHLLVTANRWSDFRAGVRDVLGTRLELRLGDPLDSEVDRRLAANVPAGRPGRGLLPSRHHVLGALPRIDGVTDGASVGDGAGRLVKEVAAAWTGVPGPKLRLLPDRVELDTVRDRVPEGDPRLYLAVDERALDPVGLDVDAEPHLLAFGDGGSGKSALLRSYLHEVVRTRTPQQAQVLVVDYRRSLLGEVPEEYLVGYLTSATQAAPAAQEMAAYLRGRIPGPDVTPEQLRSRSWWTGAELFVVVDDYDLVVTSQGSPLHPFVDLLAQARDVGLHVAVARRSGGAARALYEPLIQGLRDLSAPGVVLSGSPDEGPLVGSVKPQPGVPGRGRLVTRARGVDVVQVAWSDPAH
jgi:S-DNA-T family DNA segregation ATPase FtsK/SpoIIIE